MPVVWLFAIECSGEKSKFPLTGNITFQYAVITLTFL